MDKYTAQNLISAPDELRAGDIVQFETITERFGTQTNTITLLNRDDFDGDAWWNFLGGVLFVGLDRTEILRDMQVMFDEYAGENGMGWIRSSDRSVTEEIVVYNLRVIQRVTP